ncbi:MAG: glutathionylspermidine synthase family protein [Clostridia bacterium]|nr:glutathionylspermidine synthase family protein [Clostridia bacterium]
MTEAEKRYTEIIKSDFSKHRQGFERQMDYIKNCTAVYHGRYVRTMAVPKIFSSAQAEYLKSIAETIHTILVKIINEYLINPDFRREFMFEKELEELILSDAGYDSLLPVTRIDIFLNEDTGDFKLCEINTDGTSAMNEDRELNIALNKTDAFAQINKEFEFSTFELFDSFVKDFIKVYSTYKNKNGKPNIAIVDFLDRGTVNEFEQFRLAFERAGYNCAVCDIRDLKYKNRRLFTPDGLKIDAIYRRAVTCDIMANRAEIPDFLDAVKNADVCLIGGMRTQVAHSKILFKVLSESQNLGFLTGYEREYIKKHFPQTHLLDTGNPLIDLGYIYSHKDEFIIKPVDSYASLGVHAGGECENDAEWKKHIDCALDKGYIVQEFVKPYETLNTDFSKDNEFIKCSNLTGLYVYNGNFRGVYSRISRTEIVSTQYSEMTLATLVFK